MIPTIHLQLHREAVRIRVWRDADGLVMASLAQGLGELTLRLRQDSALSLALALAYALRDRVEEAPGSAGGALPIPRERNRLDRPERPAQRKEVLR